MGQAPLTRTAGRLPRPPRPCRHGLWALGLLALPISPGFAAGFALIEHSAQGLGNAFAGGGASATDASVIFFNPAGMVRLETPTLQLGAHAVLTGADFTNEGSRLNQAVGGGPLSGPDAESDEAAFIPNLYYTQPLSERWHYGFGLTVPFGLTTQYDDDWVGRYFGIESRLETVTLNPSFAFEVTEQLAFGFGFSAQYASAELSNAVDFGTVCLGQEAAGAVPSGTCQGLGLTPQSADGRARIEGDDWAFGVNLGALWQPNERTRLSLAFRSSIDHTLTGDGEFSVPPSAQPLTASGAFTDSDAEAGFETPETLSVSIYHALTPRLALMADVTWTNWSRFDELRVEFDNPAQPDAVTPEDWDDSLRYALGADLTMGSRWTLRGGVAYDETPIPSPERRTPRIPGNDRFWLAAGASFEANADWAFDVGYAHLFVDDTEIDHVDEATGHVLTGTFENRVDILSAQVRYRF